MLLRLYTAILILNTFLLGCSPVDKSKNLDRDRGTTDQLITEDSLKQKHYKLGFIAGQNGDFIEANKHYSKILKLDSNYKSTLYNMAISNEKKGELIQAAWDIEKLLKRNNKNAEYWAYGGELNYKLSNPKNGKKYLNQAIRLDSTRRKYFYLKGYYSLQYNQETEGCNYLWQALSIKDTTEIKIDSTIVKNLCNQTNLMIYNCHPDFVY